MTCLTKCPVDKMTGSQNDLSDKMPSWQNDRHKRVSNLFLLADSIVVRLASSDAGYAVWNAATLNYVLSADIAVSQNAALKTVKMTCRCFNTKRSVSSAYASVVWPPKKWQDSNPIPATSFRFECDETFVTDEREKIFVCHWQPFPALA